MPRFLGILYTAAVAVRNILSDLADHGTVTVTVTGVRDDLDPSQVAAAAALGMATWALNPQPGLAVGLTDLGRYHVRQRLLAENANAPLESPQALPGAGSRLIPMKKAVQTDDAARDAALAHQREQESAGHGSGVAVRML